jgi:hypothetical protein
MPIPAENVTLHVVFNTKTGALSVDSNATPPEVLQIITAIQAQLVPVFVELDATLHERMAKRDPASNLIIPVQGIVAREKVH